jgi:RES domain-containing protein
MPDDHVYRITRAPYADLTGEGARLAGGRWNRAGRAAVYASESRALAILESLVHVQPHRLPSDLVLLRVAIPEQLRRESWSLAELPEGWREIGADAALDRGDAWLRQGSAAVLRVPSVLVPEEYNVVLNPAHPEHSRIRVMEVVPFRFDARLLAERGSGRSR